MYWLDAQANFYLPECHWKMGKKVYCTFVNLVNVYDKMNKLKCFMKYEIEAWLLNAIKVVYDGSILSLKT